MDSTTTLLNSSQQFPSRLSIPPASTAHYPSIFRRLSRIFSHAYFHHREAFSLAESETSLYARFVALCERYQLVGANLLVIPPEAVSAFANEEEDEDESEESEDEDEDEDDDDKEEADEERGRGDKSESRDQEKRTRSLDRHGPPAINDFPPLKLQTNGNAETPKAEESPGQNSIKVGKGTLGRGRQARGTMLWSSDAVPPPPVPSAQEVPGTGAELSRTESNQTAVLIGEDDDQHTESTSKSSENDAPDASAGSEAVPKDEIELLEEEGIVSPESTVAPLVPGEGNSKGTSDDHVAGTDNIEQEAHQSPEESASSAPEGSVSSMDSPVVGEEPEEPALQDTTSA